jgi:hypothetical protein
LFATFWTTATVPHQKHDWMAQGVTTALVPNIPDFFKRSKIPSYVGFMSFEEASEGRQRLMDECRQFYSANRRCDGGTFFERIFSLFEQ